MMKHRTLTSGFSLIEMLVVIAIIAMIVALLMPSLNGAKASARKAQCASNLHNLGEAYFSAMKDSRGKSPIEHPSVWTFQLYGYANHSESAFFCPEDDGIGEGPWGGANPSETGFDEFVEVGSVALRVTWGSYGTVDVPFANTHPRMKVRDWECRDPGQRWRGVYPEKVDYSLIFEFSDDGNQGPNAEIGNSWNNPENQFSFVPVQREDKEYEEIDMIGWKVDAYRQKRIVYLDQVYNKTPGPGDVQLYIAPLNSSYGINNRVSVLGRDSDKVLLLDYEKLVADVVGSTAKDVWLDQAAPRHHGAMNVLFYDNSVRTKDTEEIDPRILSIHDDYWRPSADPKLGS